MPKVGDKHFAYTKAGEKAAKTHAAKTGKKVEHSGPYMKKSGFKMKGSPFQRNFGIGSPMKEETGLSYTGADIDPARSYEYKGAKIPSFRDMVSLEQQQDYAKKVDKRRADKKAIKDAGGGTYREYKKDVGKKGALSKKDWRELNLQNIEGADDSTDDGVDDSADDGALVKPFNIKTGEDLPDVMSEEDYAALEVPEEEFPEGPSKQYLAKQAYNNPTKTA